MAKPLCAILFAVAFLDSKFIPAPRQLFTRMNRLELSGCHLLLAPAAGESRRHTIREQPLPVPGAGFLLPSRSCLPTTRPRGAHRGLPGGAGLT
jgi:hypothetical protein